MSRRFLPLSIPLCLLLTVGVASSPVADLSAAKPSREQTKSSSSGKKSSSGKSTSSSGKSAASKNKGKRGSAPTSTSPSGKKASGKKSATRKTSGKSRQSAGPKSAAEARRLEEAAQREISDTKRQLKVNESDIKKGVNELGRLQGDIGTAKQKVEQAASEVSSLDSHISSLESEVASEEAQLEKLRSEYLKAIKKMRASGKNNSTLAFVFSSGSFNQALRRMRYLKEFSAWKDRQSEQINKKVSHLKQQRDLLSRSRAEKDVALRRQRQAHQELQKQYARQDAIVVELRANRQALSAHLAKKQSEVNALRNQISSFIAAEEQARRQREEAEARERKRAEEAAAAKRAAKAEEERLAAETSAKAAEEAAAKKGTASKTSEKTDTRRLAASKDKKKKDKKKKDKDNKDNKDKARDYADARKRKPRSDSPAASGKKSETPAQTKTVASTATAASGGASFEKMKGSLPRPVSGPFRVTSPFGRHALPELPDVVYDNPGIDVQVSSGASAQAVYGGKVSRVCLIPGFSTVIIVSHGNYFTVYANIESPAVKNGDTVKQGQNLGRLAVDEDDKSHSILHFEVWRNKEKLNPSEWIR